ncbi:MAG: cytochrome-c oxidase, cbb3-type subunit III [Gammaproteobacteria bacterium]
MADFIHPFWSWWVIIPTVLGLIWCAWLAYSNAQAVTDGEEGEAAEHVWDEDIRENNNPLPKWWLNLFYITVVFAFGYLILYPGLGSFQGILGWSQLGQYQSGLDDADARYAPLYEKYGSQSLEELNQNRDAMGTAGRLFSTNCSICHGADARGTAGFPNLRDDKWLYGGDGETIKFSITNGRNGVMPAWLPAVGEQGVAELTEYLISFRKTPENPELAAAGEEKFKIFCIACHGVDATGNQALGAPNLTDDTWLYGGRPAIISESISKGRQGAMPAHKDLLNENQIHLLTAYVLGLSAKP